MQIEWLMLHAHAHEGGNEILHLFLHPLLDAIKMLPFLFLAFLLIEFLEHRAGNKFKDFIARSGKAGPAIGALLGCVPQCGFSVLCANLYSGGVITLGTLIAVFLSTSDEAVLLLAAQPEHFLEIFKLLLIKLVIGLVFGYLVDLIFRKKQSTEHLHLHDLCEQDHCGCHDHGHDHGHGGLLRPALVHTVKIFGYIYLFTFLLNLGMHLLGEERLSAILLSDSVFQPFLAALFGFIPNCAASVLLTELYLEGALQFGSVIAGLCTSAGAGLLVLFRENRRPKDNLKILAILYVISVFSGVLLRLFGL